MRESRYYGDPLIGNRSEGDTVYSVVRFSDPHDPSVFTAQDRDTRAEIDDRFESWRERHVEDLIVLVSFELEMTDPDADLPLSPTNVEIIEKLGEGES